MKQAQDKMKDNMDDKLDKMMEMLKFQKPEVDPQPDQKRKE